MSRLLEITLKITSDTTFDVEIYEPQSGDFTRIPCNDSGNLCGEENARIASEIRSWIMDMRENPQDEEE